MDVRGRWRQRRSAALALAGLARAVMNKTGPSARAPRSTPAVPALRRGAQGAPPAAFIKFFAPPQALQTPQALLGTDIDGSTSFYNEACAVAVACCC
jgi:hypothetical protein